MILLDTISASSYLLKSYTEKLLLVLMKHRSVIIVKACSGWETLNATTCFSIFGSIWYKFWKFYWLYPLQLILWRFPSRLRLFEILSIWGLLTDFVRIDSPRKLMSHSEVFGGELWQANICYNTLLPLFAFRLHWQDTLSKSDDSLRVSDMLISTKKAFVSNLSSPQQLTWYTQCPPLKRGFDISGTSLSLEDRK